jgi:hypothetical protein
LGMAGSGGHMYLNFSYDESMSCMATELQDRVPSTVQFRYTLLMTFPAGKEVTW